MRKLLFTFLLCCTTAQPLFAGTYVAPTAEAAGVAAAPTITARLSSPITGVGNETVIPLTLDIKLPPSWHTYWRSPGIAGLPPSATWETKTNVDEVRIQWPRPVRFSLQGLETFGYRERVTFPLLAKVTTPGQPVVLRGRLDIVMCTEICVPAHADIAVEVPAGAASPSADADLWHAAVAQLPLTPEEAASALTHITRDGDAIKAGLKHGPEVIVHDLIVETEAQHAFKKVTVAPVSGGDDITVPFDVPAEAAQVDGQKVTLTFLATVGGVERAIETTNVVGFTATPATVPTAAAPTVTAAPNTNAAPAPAPTMPGLLLIIGFALLGGLILNLMPCVLPVLSLKLLSVISHAGESKVRIRRGFIATSLGILLSFWALAALTITLKETGTALGWGIQFQQPLFLAFLIVVVTFFTANMWGFFEIGLPRLLHNKFAAPTPGDTSILTEFLTGVFATLLATPCTAPFVGTAVGFALSRTSLDIAIIFSALGIGLASPYLLVALFPAIAHHLPRPGRWMRWLKIVLGVALLATAAWLVWVMWMQTSIVVALASLLLVALLLWALHKQQMITAIILGFLLVTAPLSLPHDAPTTPATETQAAVSWQPFAPDTVPQLVATGKTVFIDLTASWCLTCHANKELVLQAEPVASALLKGSVVLMRGDWTRPDPIIGNYLQKYQRFGIPFNIVFGPGAPDGILLPELLTSQTVLDALQKASGAR